MMFKAILSVFFLVVLASSVGGLSVSYFNCSGEVVRLEGGGLGCVDCTYGSVWSNSSSGCVINISDSSVQESSGGFSLLDGGRKVFPENPLMGVFIVVGVAFLIFRVFK